MLRRSRLLLEAGERTIVVTISNPLSVHVKTVLLFVSLNESSAVSCGPIVTKVTVFLSLLATDLDRLVTTILGLIVLILLVFAEVSELIAFDAVNFAPPQDWEASSADIGRSKSPTAQTNAIDALTLLQNL
jgi:hypothetical protein